MKLSRMLYRAARATNDFEAITSGKPSRIARRAQNKATGRAVARTGFFRFLYGPGTTTDKGSK